MSHHSLPKKWRRSAVTVVLVPSLMCGGHAVVAPTASAAPASSAGSGNVGSTGSAALPGIPDNIIRVLGPALPIVAFLATVFAAATAFSRSGSHTSHISSTSTNPSPSASAEATTNGLTPENSKGRELRLSDFQEPPVTSGWQEKRYDVASITNTMGIGTKLDWQNDDEIELRLANKFQKVTFTAGQANDSRSSDLIVRVAIFADGKEIETVDVPFNDAHAFEVKAANVNALKITFKALDQKQEMPQIDDSTIGVILNVKAE